MEAKGVFTETETAEYISMSQSFLRQSRMDGVREGRTPGPDWLQIGRAIRYRKSDLDSWLLEHRVSPAGMGD